MENIQVGANVAIRTETDNESIHGTWKRLTEDNVQAKRNRKWWKSEVWENFGRSSKIKEDEVTITQELHRDYLTSLAVKMIQNTNSA